MNGLIQWSPGTTLEAIERQVIQKAFEFYRQNKSATSRALGIAIRTLEAKLEKYALDQDAQDKRDEARKQDNDLWLERSRGIAPSGQFDNTASKPVPEPMNGLNPTGWKPEDKTVTSEELAVETTRVETAQQQMNRNSKRRA